MNKLFITCALCVVFALGTLAGSVVNRYQFVQGGKDCYRVDRLTGQMWNLDKDTAYPVEIQQLLPAPEVVGPGYNFEDIPGHE